MTPGKSGLLERHVRHDVERVGHHDDDGVGRNLGDLLGHVADDPGVGLEKIVAAHARLSGDARRDDEDVRALGNGVVRVAAARDQGVEALDGSALPLVQPLAFGDSLLDVDHDDLPGQLLLSQTLGAGGPYVSRSDDRDLPGAHGSLFFPLKARL